jgi:hypothetical protein
MVFFGGVFGFGQGGDGEQKLQEQRDREDEVEESFEQVTDLRDPEAARAGEEELREKAVEDEDEEDELDGGAATSDDAGRASEDEGK